MELSTAYTIIAALSLLVYILSVQFVLIILKVTKSRTPIGKYEPVFAYIPVLNTILVLTGIYAAASLKRSKS